MKKIFLSFILLYQKYISPYKGAACAYSSYTNKSSCSFYGYKAINKFGVTIGLKLLNRRFKLCKSCNDKLKFRLRNKGEKTFRINSNGSITYLNNDNNSSNLS